MIYTKQIVKDKFWIMENSGVKIGTIRCCSSDDFELNLIDEDGAVNEHISLSMLTSRFGEKILQPKERPVKIIDENKVGPRGGWNTSSEEIDGYASKHVVYNAETIELKDKQIPTYTKSETSKVRYAAGYYAVRFPSDWRWFYGGKLDTLNTCDFIGPFKTKSEMQTETLLANKRDGL
jgi:hypothetical protein|tara:strand:+ start:875 stop:1408 length:534 start_codon:yes stop_codon:yes gene_type:complete